MWASCGGWDLEKLLESGHLLATRAWFCLKHTQTRAFHGQGGLLTRLSQRRGHPRHGSLSEALHLLPALPAGERRCGTDFLTEAPLRRDPLCGCPGLSLVPPLSSKVG